MYGLNSLAIKPAVSAIATQALQDFDAERIVEVGLLFEKLLAEFRRDHPDEVPKKPPLGLLISDPYPVSDFELALHLVQSRPKAMIGLERWARGVPTLMAYLAVASLPSKELPPREIGWEAALQFAVRESSFRTHQLHDALEKYKLKEARRKERASVGGIKGAKTRKDKAIRHEVVVEAAKKLGWPASTSGVNKRLARKFECSADHIGRILRKAKSDM